MKVTWQSQSSDSVERLIIKSMWCDFTTCSHAKIPMMIRQSGDTSLSTKTCPKLPWMFPRSQTKTRSQQTRNKGRQLLSVSSLLHGNNGSSYISMLYGLLAVFNRGIQYFLFEAFPLTYKPDNRIARWMARAYGYLGKKKESYKSSQVGEHRTQRASIYWYVFGWSACHE